MMIQKLRFLIIFVLVLVTYTNRGESIDVQYPPETIILKTSNNKSDWKEITRNITKKRAIVECIPCKQNEKRWKKKICIEYMHKSIMNMNTRNSLHSMIEGIRCEIYRSFPSEYLEHN